MHNNLLAIVFALLSALTIAWGTVVRHRIAEESPNDGSLEGSPLWRAVSRPLWWAGTGTALLGYGLQIVALGFGTLLVVQPILVLSLMFTIPLSARYNGTKVSQVEVFWSAALTAAVAILVLVGRPTAGDPFPPLRLWLIALGVGAVVMLGLIRLARHLMRGERALLLGIVTGGIFGYVALLSKAVVDIALNDGPLTLLTTWEGYGLVAGAALGTIVQQYSFNAGALRKSLPAMTVTEPLVAFGLGYVVLGESFQVSSWGGWLVMALAVVTMVLSTFALSRRSVG